MHAVLLSSDGTIMDMGGPLKEEPLHILGRAVMLEAGYTLRSFFAMIGKYPVLAKLGSFLADKTAEFVKENEAVPGGPQELVLGKTVELIGFPGEPRLEIYTQFRGMDNGEAVELRFIDPAALMDCPVVLGNVKHIMFGDEVSVLEYETTYNLFEFVDGVAWELGFHGAPKQCGLRR